jgi:SAM-dependent methyltransferase
MRYLRTARRLWQGGSLAARALAARDSHTFVRGLFLSAAARLGMPEWLRGGGFRLADAVASSGATDPELVRAWLRVGVELGELRERAGVYRAAGARLRAMAGGDALLVDHYRSFTEYQSGVYAQLPRLLTGATRDDLTDFAGTIAAVSRAAEHFVSTFVAEDLAGLRPASLLDVGCGSGVYLRETLRRFPSATGVGIDLSADVVAAARDNLAAWGLSARATVRQADVRSFDGGFDLVTFFNCIYYFPGVQRAETLARARELLRPGGHVVVVTMVAPGSVAAAHLDLMLRVQRSPADLPSRPELLAQIRAAGFEVRTCRRVVPTEPYWGIVARRR